MALKLLARQMAGKRVTREREGSGSEGPAAAGIVGGMVQGRADPDHWRISFFWGTAKKPSEFEKRDDWTMG